MSKSSTAIRRIKNSFLEMHRSRAGLEPPALYKALGWSRGRYAFHIKYGCVFPIKELNKLARIIKMSEAKMRESYFKFYSSHSSHDRAY